MSLKYHGSQIGIKDPSVDYASNCGNMTSAIGPFAIEKGMPFRMDDSLAGTAVVAIYNTNTKKVINAVRRCHISASWMVTDTSAQRFPIDSDGQPEYGGDFAIDGVAGLAARIQLDFVKPGGSRTGKLLPTGRKVDTIKDIPGLGDVPASLIDCANPCIFVKAADLGVDGTMLPEAIAAHPTLLKQLEDIRQKGGVLMGLFGSIEEAAKTKSVPKVCFVSEPAAHTLLSGERVEDASQADVLIRTISTGDPHRAIPITVAICSAAAANLEGSIVHSVMNTDKRADPEGITLAHPSGKIVVAATMRQESNGETGIESGTIYRTARKLFEGKVFYRA